MMLIELLVLSKLANPLLNPPWENISPIEPDEVWQRVAAKNFNRNEYGFGRNWSRELHVERIAYLIQHPSTQPIILDFSQQWIIYDGNHRVASAILTNQETIWAEVYGPKSKIKLLYEPQSIPQPLRPSHDTPSSQANLS